MISTPFTIEKNDSLYFPTTNWILYGLNVSNGGKWNESDWSYTFTGGESTKVLESDVFNEEEEALEMNATYSEKQSADIKKIKKRLKEMGIKGWLIFVKTKLNVTWSNGDYDYVSKLSNIENINKLYEYVVGNRKVFILYYCQICKATILLLFAVAVCKEVFSPEKENLYRFIYISIFGAFLFYLIWEVLSRYSLTFLPWLMLVFGIGITQIENIINIKNISIKLRENKNIDLNVYKIIRKISICTLAITVFLLVVNFHDLAIKESTYWDKKVAQFRETGDKLNIISDKIIEQTFKTDETFNSISIKMKKSSKNIKSVTHYNFVLSDVEGNVLKTIEFTSDDVKNDCWKTFNIGKIKPEGNQEYKIKIYSSDAADDNSIGVASCYVEGYSVYPDGEMTVNGEFFDADLTFKVRKKNKRNYISKKWFIVMSSIIIGIEIFAFYSYLRKKDEKNMN